MSWPADNLRAAASSVAISFGAEHARVILVVEDTELVNDCTNPIDGTLSKRTCDFVDCLYEAGIIDKSISRLTVVACGSIALEICTISHIIVAILPHQVLVVSTSFLFLLAGLAASRVSD